jgi:hypothetical protein
MEKSAQQTLPYLFGKTVEKFGTYNAMALVGEKPLTYLGICTIKFEEFYLNTKGV